MSIIERRFSFTIFLDRASHGILLRRSDCGSWVTRSCVLLGRHFVGLDQDITTAGFVLIIIRDATTLFLLLLLLLLEQFGELSRFGFLLLRYFLRFAFLLQSVEAMVSNVGEGLDHVGVLRVVAEHEPVHALGALELELGEAKALVLGDGGAVDELERELVEAGHCCLLEKVDFFL